MRPYHLTILLFLIVAGGAACAPRQLKPVASIDPAPLLEKVYVRQTAMEKGVSGSLELAFKNSKQRFTGKVYVVAYTDGRFRLEVPGPFGGTHLVMANDNNEILAFYPGKNKAFRSAVDGRSINPHLPFPLPVKPARLPALIMGVIPQGSDISGVQAHLMDSGEKQLQTATADDSLQFTWLFGKGPENRLLLITVRGEDLEVSVQEDMAQSR